MQKTIVVIGGAQGGPIAAARAREFAEDARIVLVEKTGHVNLVQASLRHHLQGDVKNLDVLHDDRRGYFERRYRIDVKTHAEAIGLDNDARRVVVQTPDGVERIPYDAVIFAGGAGTVRPHIPGLEGDCVTAFRDHDDLEQIRARIAKGAKRAVVLGAGGSGIDAAQGLRASGLEVTVVERESRILPGLSIPAARAAARAVRTAGITLRLGDVVESASPRKGGLALTLRSGASVDADLVVLATGMAPRSALLQAAGASLHADGTIRVDRFMQTTLHRVYACGTAVSVPHVVTGAPSWLAQDAVIARTAQIAGRSAAVGPEGVREELIPVAGTALHEVGDQFFARTGISDAVARSAFGDDRVAVSTLHSWSSEAWLGGELLTVRLVVDRATNAVVGGEVWGRHGVARRIDVIAAAVVERWSPARLAALDLGYTPSRGPANDPVTAAGTLAAMTLAGEAAGIDPELLALRLARGDALQVVDVGTHAGLTAPLPAGTRAIPLEDLRESLDGLARDKPVVVVSHTGRRAHLAARILRQRGFETVLHLDGGAITWDLMHAD